MRELIKERRLCN